MGSGIGLGVVMLGMGHAYEDLSWCSQRGEGGSYKLVEKP